MMLVILSLALLYCGKLLYQPAMDVYTNYTKMAELKPKVEDLTRKYDDIQNAERASQDDSKYTVKKLYTPDFPEGDTVTVFGALFEDVIQFAKFYDLKVRSIEYKPSPADDEILKNAGSSHHVCQVDISMVGSYQQFQGFYKELFKYPYLINFAKIEIIPYDKNKKFLIYDVSLVLYAKK